MTRQRLQRILVGSAAISFVILLSSMGFASAVLLGTWTSTTSYPTTISDQSCPIYSGYIYCVGGFSSSLTSAVNSAPVSSSGVGTWSSTTSYPLSVDGESCAIDSGYIYCVGGFDGGLDPNQGTADVESATVASGVVGTWSATTSYPLNGGGYPETFTSCAIYSGYIYCVGGNNNNNGVTASVYYATESSGTVGTWTSTTSYPFEVSDTSCNTASGYIYCVAGYDGSTLTTISTVYYATVSSSGVGTWTSTTSYPAIVQAYSCSIYSGYIYCVGGDSYTVTNAVFSAAVSSSGVGSWTYTTSYPFGLDGESCATNSGYLYCVGGTNAASTVVSSVYYDQIDPATPVSVPTLSAATIDVNQPETVSASIPSWGVAPYSWSWLISINGGSYSTATQCAINSGTGAIAGAAKTCSISASTLTSGDTYNFELKATDSDSGTATSGASSTLTVDPALSAGAITPSSPSIISGNSQLLTANPSGGTGTYSSYQWYSGSSSTCSSDTTTLGTASTQSVSPTSSTYYCYKVTDSAAATATSPTDLVTVTTTVSTTTSVTCSPVTVTAGSSSTCTATVTGSSPTGTITWSSSSGTGVFSSGTCALSGGSCAVTYHDPTGGAPVITGSYGGDSGNMASSGSFILANFATSATAAESTSTSTSGSGGATVDQQGTTGVDVVISGAPDNTPVTVFSSVLSSQPPGTGTLSISALGFYDIEISGITSGTANVCIFNAAVIASTVLQYYYLGAWDSATGVVDSVGVSICGNIPVLALNDPVVVPGDPPATPQFPFSFGLAAVFLASIVIYALVRRTVGVHRPVVSAGRV